MSARAAALRGRAAFARLAVDTATITRPDGAATLNTTTGVLTPVAGTEIHEGPCRLRQPTAEEQERIFGEQQVTTSRFMACFPHDVIDIAVDDIVTITASDDADLLDRSFRVLSIPMMTYSMYKGFPVELVE